MKTNLLLFAALLISTITFSQTTKKGYDHYKASNSSAQKMNKGELIDAIAKDAGNSKREGRRIGKRNPQSGKVIKVTKQTKDLILNQSPSNAPGDPIPDIDITKDQSTLRGKAQDHNASRSNTTGIKLNPNNNIAAKSDRNPQAKGVIKPKKVAKFKAGKALADTVKNH